MSALYFDIINGLIDHTDKEKYLYESNGQGGAEVLICKIGNEFYQEHREELYKRKFYFMSIKNDKINIYVRPEGWKKK